MTIYKTALWTSMCALAVGAVGCDVNLNTRSRQEPVYLQQQQPQYVVEPQPQYVYVQQAPPAVIVERRPAPPSPTHIWIDGYWNWDNQRYTWRGGRYEVPPQPDVIWIAPRYDADPRGTRFTPGQWKKQAGNNPRPNQNPGNGHGNDHDGR